MEWKKAVLKSGNDVEIPRRWLHLYYYEALNILFRFENDYIGRFHAWGKSPVGLLGARLALAVGAEGIKPKQTKHAYPRC